MLFQVCVKYKQNRKEIGTENKMKWKQYTQEPDLSAAEFYKAAGENHAKFNSLPSAGLNLQSQ